MHERGPIGVFDSGFGGLSVLREIRAALPGEDLIYYADHAALPYGEQSASVLRTRAQDLTRVLVAARARAIVIACNTATAAAADHLRARFDLPVIGMEPAVKPAVAATASGVVGVLGTGGTLGSARFAGLLQRYADDLRVITRPAPELVHAVETADGATCRAVAAKAVAPLLDAGVDVIVLGCTHFPLIRAEIEASCGPGVTLIDTGPAVARELVRRLTGTADGPTLSGTGSTAFWTTGDSELMLPVLARLWGAAADLQHVPIRIRGTADGETEAGSASRLS